MFEFGLVCILVALWLSPMVSEWIVLPLATVGGLCLAGGFPRSR